MPTKIGIDEAIDRLTKGRFQRRLLAAAGMCNGVNAMAVMALSFIRNAIIIDFDISIDQSNWFESSVFFGILFGKSKYVGDPASGWLDKQVIGHSAETRLIQMPFACVVTPLDLINRYLGLWPTGG